MDDDQPLRMNFDMEPTGHVMLCGGIEYEVMHNPMNTDTQNTKAPGVFASEGMHARRLDALNGRRVVELSQPDRKSTLISEPGPTIADQGRHEDSRAPEQQFPVAC